MDSCECPRFDECNASVCPMRDEQYLADIRGFYADEDEICQLRRMVSHQLVTTMRRIQNIGGSGLFTVKMLRSIKRVKQGLEGLPFEASYGTDLQRSADVWITSRKQRGVKSTVVRAA